MYKEHLVNLFISLHITEVMLQYISYLQLCSNVLQNKLSRRQQKYIVNVYKTVQLTVHFLYDYWLCSVSSYVLRKRNKMPKNKGKKYTNHVDLTPLKTQPACVPQWRAGGAARPSPGTASQPQSEAISGPVATGRWPLCSPPGGHCLWVDTLVLFLVDQNATRTFENALCSAAPKMRVQPAGWGPTPKPSRPRPCGRLVLLQRLPSRSCAQGAKRGLPPGCPHLGDKVSDTQTRQQCWAGARGPRLCPKWRPVVHQAGRSTKSSLTSTMGT